MPRLREEDIGGITEHRIDGAGRITLSADQRRAFPDGKVCVMLWMLDGCLRLCRPDKVDELVEQIISEWPDRRLRAIAIRQTVGTIRQVTIDESGRIRIPFIYLEFVGLDGHNKRAWLVPYEDGIFELWNPDDFRKIAQIDLYAECEAIGTEVGQMSKAGAEGTDA